MKVLNLRGRIRRRILIAMGAGSLAVVSTASGAPLDTNLVVNPSFEAVDTGTVVGGYNALLILDWEGGGAAYDSSQAYDNGGPLAGGGVKYFTPNAADNFEANPISQEIDLSTGETGTAIPTGLAQYDLSAYFSSYATDGDFGSVTVDFLDSADTILESALITDSDTTTWTQESTSGLIPIGTETAQISAFGTALEGGPDGYIDLVDFTVTGGALENFFRLDVNRINGQMAISAGTANMDINAYEITSALNSLNPSGWQAGNLEARGVDAVEDPGGATPGPGNDPGETWQVFDASDGRLTEAFLFGSSLFGGGSGRTESIGSGYDVGQDAQDVVFMVTTTDGNTVSAFVNYFESGVLLGDVNLDGDVNGLDVDPFVDVLLNGPFQAEADMNVDKVVNGLDVDPFVAAVVGGGAAAVPEPATFALLAVAVTFVGFGWVVRRQR
jgi:hypothetical protein